jgi:uncharacterized membrane-anchored protein YhcB (DUF1043 family)
MGLAIAGAVLAGDGAARRLLGALAGLAAGVACGMVISRLCARVRKERA